MVEAGAYVWSRIGGHLALDLCNTMSWRLDAARRIDRLADPADLVNWFATVVGEADRGPLMNDLVDRPAEADRALEAVRRLRDTTVRVVDAQVDGDPADPADLASITTAWRRALGVATFPARLPLAAVVDPTTVPALVSYLALSVVDLVNHPDPSRLRRCDGEGCGWLFLDSTRNRSRRWCDPLDCGNRARVRNYVQRQRRTG
ncbi:CGNR zinc finger domain-containing protein [Micromonospora sp. CA-249363]|uniref:CGNR zinc finger domain-containing protein n=1 Tax=Micromonospora sp. CA-249363 TaxID=3239963 RepID=UPI003D926823